MTRALRSEIRGMVKSTALRREAARLTPPRIGRGKSDMTLEGYFTWLSRMGRAFPAKLRPISRPERFTLP